MTKLIGTLVVSGTLVLLPALARSHDDEWDAGEEAETAPSSTPPSELPPALPSESPPAPPAQAQAPSTSVPAGQWVYTQQYGWVWTPYSDDYTYSPPGGYGEPYVYAYYPAYGWTWLVAPWVWGFGPRPFFGVYGPARFGWYAHGWWRQPARWHYAPSYGYRSAPAYGRGAGYSGVRPAPYAGGSAYRGAPRPVPHRAGGSSFVGSGRGGGYGSRVGRHTFTGRR
jgi:hypothetical protein